MAYIMGAAAPHQAEGLALNFMALVDWDRMVEQMHVFGTGEYVAVVEAHGGIPREMAEKLYGRGCVLNWSTGPGSRGWYPGKGWMFDGENPDLGPVNGGYPLTEQHRANMMARIVHLASPEA